MYRYIESLLIRSTKKIILTSFTVLFTNNVYAVDTVDLTPSISLCQASIGELNKQFSTINSLDSNGSFPEDSGLIVHTIHGPGTGAAELNMKKLNALDVDTSKTCGQFMNMTPPVYLPWCGSNKNTQTNQWDDASSWTYLRHDTLIHGTNIQRPDEVVCDDSNNKKYGFIFSNAYMNENNNLGCMYPLDGDTGNRSNMGCGISQNPHIDRTDAQGRCPSKQTANQYEADFSKLLTDDNGQYSSYAGSLICSLSKPQFNLWVEARKHIDLSKTAWPVNEFVLFNWDSYSTLALKNNKYIVGVYYLTGCANASSGNRQQAQAIADLYKKWSGVEVPVVNLSNSAMRSKSNTPFSCL